MPAPNRPPAPRELRSGQPVVDAPEGSQADRVRGVGRGASARTAASTGSLVDGGFYASRGFGTWDLAVVAVEDIRRLLERDGWTGSRLCHRITGAPTKNSMEAVKRTPDAIARDLAGLIKQGNDLRRDSLELARTAKELLRRAARLKGIFGETESGLQS